MKVSELKEAIKCYEDDLNLSHLIDNLLGLEHDYPIEDSHKRLLEGYKKDKSLNALVYAIIELDTSERAMFNLSYKQIFNRVVKVLNLNYVLKLLYKDTKSTLSTAIRGNICTKYDEELNLYVKLRKHIDRSIASAICYNIKNRNITMFKDIIYRDERRRGIKSCVIRYKVY
ncbi:hypothetical protein D3C81_08030 [compost metagenome]